MRFFDPSLFAAATEILLMSVWPQMHPWKHLSPHHADIVAILGIFCHESFQDELCRQLRERDFRTQIRFKLDIDLEVLVLLAVQPRCHHEFAREIFL